MRPLGDLVSGVLTVHFAGKSVTRRMSLSQARSFHEMADGERATDELAWHDLGWLQFDNSKVLASEFDAEEDLGWNMTAEERKTLRANGHPHGALKSLLNRWSTKGGKEPSYSVAAVKTLMDLALSGAPEDQFGLLADALEGEKGARLVQATLDDILGERPNKIHPRPEDTPRRTNGREDDESSAPRQHEREATIEPDDSAQPDDAPGGGSGSDSDLEGTDDGDAVEPLDGRQGEESDEVADRSGEVADAGDEAHGTTTSE